MFTIRKAQESDCSFLANIILIAEDTGYEITAYTKMFNKSNEELQPIFEKIINNEIEGHPLTYKSYLIACENGNPVAALAVYLEGEFGDSNHLTTGALMNGFDRKSIISAFGFLKKHSELSITKKIKTLQVDCVATLPEHRGKGLLRLLLSEIEVIAKKRGVEEIQIQLWKKNENAMNAYKKLGFVFSEERLSLSEVNNGKVLLIKKI